MNDLENVVALSLWKAICRRVLGDFLGFCRIFQQGACRLSTAFAMIFHRRANPINSLSRKDFPFSLHSPLGSFHSVFHTLWKTSSAGETFSVVPTGFVMAGSDISVTYPATFEGVCFVIPTKSHFFVDFLRLFLTISSIFRCLPRLHGFSTTVFHRVLENYVEKMQRRSGPPCLSRFPRS